MAEPADFRKKQLAFAAHIRDPAGVAAPAGIEDRRMKIYRDLFFNNLSNLLGSTFPVLKKIHSKAHWQRFIRQFMQKHRAKTPYFLQLPQEFLNFLQDEYRANEDDFPFLQELAHYEYAEVRLAISERSNDFEGVLAEANLLSHVPVKSVLAEACVYQFPVHRISVDYLPVHAPEQATFLVIYRRADDTVKFMELNPVTAALFDAIGTNEQQKNGEQLLRELAFTANYPDTDAFVKHGAEALDEMRQLEILTGGRTPQNGD